MMNKPLVVHGLQALCVEWGLLSCGFGGLQTLMYYCSFVVYQPKKEVRK